MSPAHDETVPFVPPSPEFVEFMDFVNGTRTAMSLDTSVPRAGEYTEIRTHIPPMLEIVDGRLVLKLIHGHLTLSAEIGDGAYFFHQLTDKLIDPALRAYAAAHDPALRAYAAAHDPAAPND